MPFSESNQTPLATETISRSGCDFWFKCKSMSKDKPTPGGRAKKNTAVSPVRSSAAEYLTFVAASGNSEASVEMRYEDENVWLTQKMMATLYDVSVSAINQHLKRIFSDNELEESSVVKQYLTTATDGKGYQTKHYGLQAIIAVGFKIESERAVQFRKWANQIVKDYTIQGWTMDAERLKRGGNPTRKELATHSPGSPGRTFSRTFCPGSVGVMKRFPGHSVREGCSLTTSETTTEQLWRQFSRQTVATASLRPSTTVSLQTSRHLGGMNKTDAEQGVNPAKYPVILAGFATRTNSRTFCPDGGRRRFRGSRHESRHGVAIFESLGGGIRNPEKLSGFCEAFECASESRL